MKVFEEIKNTKGSNEKQLIAINKFKDKHFEIMNMCYNEIVYGISEEGIAKAVGYDKKIHNKYEDLGAFIEQNPFSADVMWSSPLSELIEILENTSGNEQIRSLELFFIKKTKTDEMSWIIRAIQKNMRIGISLKSYNKILKARGMKELYVRKIQLCGKVIQDEFKTLINPRIAEYKYDGERTESHVSKINNVKEIKFISRGNNDITSHYPEIVDYFSKFLDSFSIDVQFVFDGEIISKDFKKLSTRMHLKAENIIERDETLKIIVFDILELDGVNLRSKPLFLRHQILKIYNLNLAYMEIVNSPEELDLFYKKAIKSGAEGVVTKDLDMKWIEDSRKGWYKIVPKENIDLKIIDCYYGKGKFANQINGVVVENKDGTIRTKAASGITDFYRELLTELHDKDELVGKIVEISYRELEPAKDGVNSLRFPVFIRLRDDKTESD